ncbi:MAG TPA: DUF3098 domain-containing protein [Bacteroidales bacterium]|jgi:hypothetical protein|nr:DUF3098 domain-containing protein [Bacteroidales bacterium]HRS19419.1 DUF3098 domain-containing protein [Bacteroidales bacterium]
MVTEKGQSNDTQFALGKENYILMAVGVVILIVGFILLSGGKAVNPNDFYPNGDPSQTPEIFSFRRITLAPIVILFGFFFEIFAIMVNPDSKIIKLIFRTK